jgi:hypothetical protein
MIYRIWRVDGAGRGRVDRPLAETCPQADMLTWKWK